MAGRQKGRSNIRAIVLETFAWGSLVAAFVIGQIASQIDYESLLRAQFPDVELSRVERSAGPPVFRIVEPSGEISSDAVVMADGNGYGGPLVIGIRARRTEDGARINRVVLLSQRETPSFIARVNKNKFFPQFAGRSVTDNFIIGDDIDGVSGATISAEAFAEAVREAVHLGAVQHLGLAETWDEPAWRIGPEAFVLVALFALAFFRANNRGKFSKYARYAVMAGSLVFVGFYTNTSVSLGQLGGIVMGYVPSPKHHPLWWIMILGTLGSVVIVGRNIYCHQICPFLVVQDLAQKISGIKLRIKPQVQRRSRTVIFFLSWVALMLIFLSAHPALGSYEPFAMMFSLEGLGIQWYILPATLLGSFFVPKFWCRMFCPVGLYLNEGVRLRRKLLQRLRPLAPAGGGKERQVVSASGKQEDS